MDPINPPEGVPLGERITFEGYGNEPDAQLNPKKNIFGKLAPDLLTNAGKLSYRSAVGIASAWCQSIRTSLDCGYGQHYSCHIATRQQVLSCL